MSNTWSGPGRALQFHLDLFAKVDRASDWIEAHAGKGATPNDILNAPNTLRQRLKLMTSMGDNLGVVVMDGKTVATMPDEVNQFYSQYNVARGVGLINHEYNILNRGETHYVSHHITTMIAEAAEQCGDEPLFPTDLPCPNGLMVFEYPLLIPDLHPDTGETVDGLDMPVRAIAWGLGDVHARRQDGRSRPGDGDAPRHLLRPLHRPGILDDAVPPIGGTGAARRVGRKQGRLRGDP